MRLFLSLLLAVFLPTAALAQAAAEYCPAIEDDAARLACFDIAFAGQQAPPAPPQSPGSDWSIDTETSAMTDETSVFVTLRAEETVTCGWGGPSRPRLMLRCMENTTSVIINTSCHMTSGHGGYGQVTYRLDDAAPRDRNFTESTDNRALGLWRGRQAIPFIRDMFGHERLLMRMTPFNENPIEISFNITGTEEAVGALRAACNW